MTADTTTTTQSTIVMERTLEAPIARVFAAWTDPALMSRWYCPNPAWEIAVERDLRVGGDYTVSMGPHDVVGRYTAIEEPTLLEFTWRWAEFDHAPSLVRVELSEVDGRTRLVLTHSDLVDAEDVKNHAEGWSGCLVRLPGALAT